MAAEDPLAELKNETTENLLALARITESAERFEDMCSIMGSLVKKKHAAEKPLEVEERNMLSVAYKNVVGQRRASWRCLKADEENADEKESAQLKEYKQKYKQVVEAELEGKCQEVLDLLQNYLISAKTEENEEAVETQVFYLKMSGDYYRYLAEFSEQEEHKTKAEEQYNTALDKAKASLAPTHPTRLGLALNASVCYYEIMKKPNKACELAKEAFDEAIQKLDSLSDSTYKDSTLIMQLLRDNLTIWTSESDNNNTIEENED